MTLVQLVPCARMNQDTTITLAYAEVAILVSIVTSQLTHVPQTETHAQTGLRVWPYNKDVTNVNVLMDGKASIVR